MPRQAIREALAALFADTGFNKVYAYQPVDIEEYDKVLAIYSARSRHKVWSGDWAYDLYTFSVDVFVKRTGGETAEDTLDALHEVVRDVIRDNSGGNANWDHLSLEADSRAFSTPISGIAYRVETHRLEVKEATTT
jgi:hypothetical protein